MRRGLFALLLLLLGATAVLWLGQDRIIGLFVAAANQHLRTPVQVGRLELAWWADFPRVSIALHDVRVRGSLPADTALLARLPHLHCSFDAWDLLTGRYRIRSLTLSGGYLRLRHDARGEANYQVFRADTSANAQPVTFTLERVRLRGVALSLADSLLHHRYAGQAHDLTAALSIAPDSIWLNVRGPLRVEGLHLGRDQYLAQRELTLAAELLLDRKNQRLTLRPAELRIDEAAYELAGQVGWGGATHLDLRVSGRQTDVPGLLALLPPRLRAPLAAYRSRGEVYFGGTVRGELSARQSPRIDLKFGCRGASLYHPNTRQTLEQLHLSGSFSNGQPAAARNSVLVLDQVRGQLRGRAFSGRLRYANFADPDIDLTLRADLDVADVLRFYPTPAVRQGSGLARLDARLRGNLRAFRRDPARAASQVAGELELRGVSLQLRALQPAFTDLRGSLLLRRNDVAVTDFRGRFGQSDFRLSGLFGNALGWLLLPRQELRIEADVAARFVNLDELLSAQAPAKAPGAGRVAAANPEYAFELPPALALDLNARVERLRFRRVRARALAGTVRLQRQVLSTPGINLRAAGGQFAVRGSLDARQAGLVQVRTVASCRQVPLDSLFYSFENFGQGFLTDRHLRGELTATADADLFFTPQLRPLTDKLEAEVHATVRRGELNNFAPLQKLSMVASREQLRRLRFDELTNTIYIQSGTVYVPEMDIRSNVRAAARLSVTGTHTFDQQMDYHLAIPLLPGLRRPVLRTADGALATAQGPELLLHVWGDEDNFRVGYDRQRAQARRGPRPAGGREAPAVATTESPAPAPAPRLREVLRAPLKPAEKKPAVPQPGEYFDF